MTVLAGLVILITLPVSYGVVKGISFAYEAKYAKVSALHKAAAQR
ncbi:hypothetical protein [Acetilactobacillus jinshanensis]|nr:hypothetical protein [Acetilactobacillus jinshanensis]